MNRFWKLLVVFLFGIVFSVGPVALQAQPPKPKPAKPSVAKPKPSKPVIRKDSTAKPLVTNIVTGAQKDTIDIPAGIPQWQLYTDQTGITQQDHWFIIKPAVRPATDYVFYLLVGLLLMLGLIRYVFPKYFGDLFGLFFRITFKQKAIRERLLENSLPSMMLNGLYFISAGFFLYTVSGYYQWRVQGSFWYSVGFWIVLLIVIYGFKWLLLKTMGWLFQVQEASNTYTFIVFLVNKVLGVLLLPVVVLMLLGPVSLHPALVTIVLFLLAALFIYRYIISYPGIKAIVRLNQFHFFLYLCAFEVVPLLIIYKGLAMRFSSSI